MIYPFYFAVLFMYRILELVATLLWMKMMKTAIKSLARVHIYTYMNSYLQFLALNFESLYYSNFHYKSVGTDLDIALEFLCLSSH